MKTKILFILLAVALVATISAQPQPQPPGPGSSTNPQGDSRARGERQPRTNRPTAETVTITGSMVVASGMPALKSGEVTYFVTGISRLIGFVDGLKEGAQVTVEGRSMANPRDETVKFLRVTKLTIGGKSYEITTPQFNFGSMMSWWGSRMPQRLQAPQRPQMPQRFQMPKRPQAPRTPQR